VTILVALLTAAPTAGDIGSCGQKVVPLDLDKYTRDKEIIDCSRCGECGLTTKACAKACDKKLDVVPFPDGCVPLVHDGEVCLDALTVASCSDYAKYEADVGPTIPTECDFCPPQGGAGGR
jgi:hypothetical protein